MTDRARLTVERPSPEPTSLIFLHARNAGGLGRSTYTMNQPEARDLAWAMLAAVNERPPRGIYGDSDGPMVLTPLGARLRTSPAPEHLGGGVLLHLDMVDSLDTRYAEVYLDEESLTALTALLQPAALEADLTDAPEGSLYVAPSGDAYRLRGTGIDWEKAPYDDSPLDSWPRRPDFVVTLPGGSFSTSHELPPGSTLVWAPAPDEQGA